MANKRAEKKITLSFQVPMSFKKKIDAAAKNEGLLVSRYIREHLEVSMTSGPKVREMLRELSETHDLSESKIINRILIAYLADLTALREQYPDSPISAPEFMKSKSNVPIGEDALLKILLIERLRTWDLLKKADALLENK